MKKMHIRIRPDGTTHIKVEGAVGAECKEFTRTFENAVGELVSREHTEAYHQDAVSVSESASESV
jgi:hypothetical protein